MDTKTLAFGIAVALAVAAPTARADEAVDKWYVTPLGYVTWTSNAKNTDDGGSYGLALGRNFGEHFSLEAAWLNGRFDGAPGTGRLRLNAYSLDGLFHFYRQSPIHPYLTVGIARSDGSRPGPGDDGSGSGVQAGLGVMSNLYTNAQRTFVLSLRGEVKSRWVLVGARGNREGQADTLAGLGLQFQFGPPLPVPAPVAATEEPPAPAAPPPPPPRDSDGDGVPDDIDKCPNTPAGARVDANGCEIEEIVLRGVNFDFNKSTLRPESTGVLDSVVALLKSRGDTPVEIRGHTDAIGGAEYNQKLSERRAQAVVDYLVSKGVNRANLKAIGYGKTRPIATNETEQGRAQNRRVALQFTGYAQK